MNNIEYHRVHVPHTSIYPFPTSFLFSIFRSPPHHTIANHVFCADRRFPLSCRKIEITLDHKSILHRHNNNIKRSRTTTHNTQHSTGVAQRKRARLITLRTPDRNGSPVLLHFGCFKEAPNQPV